ncbi:thiamine pyrophosphate-binding protein [Conexibacter woesei]|uniref:thiamine pyrophosphate-binding protein n=1 Tax=Conexibacter woesei TaxID=191495 RepID=UPI0004169EFB|nr:thiamine pyrophosphate-binding protein [Conexibacter woesei]
MADTEKYANVLVSWLRELGYTHCFFVAGGNIMHLIDGIRDQMTCIPTVHEVAAGLATEAFNAAEGEGRAFALVTAGPGMTNAVTALASAWLESRELLMLGGQVKTEDLNRGAIRQRGIQEVDGRDIAAPVSVASVRMETPMARHEVAALVEQGRTGRRGPVFLEICLDVTAAPVVRADLEAQPLPAPPAIPAPSADDIAQVRALLEDAERPLLLLGGGLTRTTVRELLPALRAAGIPFMTTWNGIDRVGSDEPLYLGRPNTWGQRSANVIMQSADLLVALGTRLGLQQTGFNWQQFIPVGQVVQVDIDAAELAKGHPRVDVPIEADANALLAGILDGEPIERPDWLAFGRHVREVLPIAEDGNEHREGYLDPFRFTLALADLATADDVFIPCSSGGANSVSMQSWQQKAGQVIFADKGLASMGIGLSSAMGAAFAHPSRRTIMIEGDGGFAQNLQELGTVAAHDVNLKIFLCVNEGYASIRTTQRNYFGGAYLGCDTKTGLGFPAWEPLFAAFGIPVQTLADGWERDSAFLDAFGAPGPAAFIVPVDPEQTYLPKITSRVTESGSMESNPLHMMSPELPDDVAADVLRHIVASGQVAQQR